MMKGIGTFINRRTKTGKKSYDRFFIYVPTEVARDGTFPFMEGEKVEIEIKGKIHRVIPGEGFEFGY